MFSTLAVLARCATGPGWILEDLHWQCFISRVSVLTIMSLLGMMVATHVVVPLGLPQESRHISKLEMMVALSVNYV